MRSIVVKGWLSFCLVLMGAATAQQSTIKAGELDSVLHTFKGPGATESPTIYQDDNGFIKFLGAPPNAYFEAEVGANKASSPESIASAYVAKHAGAFGVADSKVSLSTTNVKEHGGSSFVRLNQSYDGIPVFGAQMVVQVSGGNILNLANDTFAQSESLANGGLSLTPKINAASATAAGQRALAAVLGNVGSPQLRPAGEADLMVLNPGVLGLEGSSRLVWRNTLTAVTADGLIKEAIFVDAHTGQLALHYSLTDNALSRSVYNANGTFNQPANPARIEGQAAVANANVNNMYDYLGDSYNFYFTQHQWDSFDNADSPLVATVNVPFYNACWGCTLRDEFTEEELESGEINEMLFDGGLVIDDVVAHELTHGVTQETSGLIYLSFSGAINESFSDIWGEYVDLTNGRGNDSEEVRWLVGEDMSAELVEAFGLQDAPVPGIRSMSDPTLFGDPDRLGSPLLADPFNFAFDGGGVHINSGIGNKLAYLLTDGDEFNGQDVDGFGINRTADLFFATQFLLPEASSYYDLYLALAASAVAQGYSFADRINIDNAAKAVEIIPPGLLFGGLSNFRAVSTFDTDNNPVVALTWTNPEEDAFTEVILIRSVDDFATALDEGVEIYRGRADKFLDTNVQEDITYYYTLIAEVTVDPDLVDGVEVPTGARVIQMRFARAEAGTPPAIVLSEAFGNDPEFGLNNPMDLQYSQILFEPIAAPPGTEPGVLNGGGSYADYEVVYKKNVTELPVVRDDGTDASYLINLLEDGYVRYNLLGGVVFPFFGRNHSSFIVYTNGYIGFDFPIPADNVLNFPNIGAHFAIPRIAPLFADLAPLIGGDMWIRSMDDRAVITYERLPEWRVNAPFGGGGTNTVQVELFSSGHIRFTYLELDVENAVVGLSDGNGVPRNPFIEFDDIIPFSTLVDFSTMPEFHTALSIDPITPVFAEVGDRVNFTATTTNSVFDEGTPSLTATWDGTGPAPFGNNGNGTGTFDWQTTTGDEGLYVVRVVARLGVTEVFQDVRINIGNSLLRPEARNLKISTNNPAEDPTVDRTVPVEATLFGSYDYYHPLLADNPALYGEGPSIFYWFRNGQVVPSLTGSPAVQAALTRGGDRWQFRVIPISLNGVDGEVAVSPLVTVIGSPNVTSLTPSFGTYDGGTSVRIRGTRLSGALTVKFGGVAAVNVSAISDTEMLVVTPKRPVGTVDVTVESPAGVGIFRNGFSYIDPAEILVPTDVNGDGKVDSVDVQLVINAVLKSSPTKDGVNPDANRDGQVNSLDLQAVVNGAVGR